MTTLDHADDFDLDLDLEDSLRKIARFARKHDVRAHVTRTGTVLLVGSMGEIRTVRTMRACCEWLGY